MQTPPNALPADEATVLAWLDAAPLNRETRGEFHGLSLAPIRAILAHLPSPPPPLTVAGTKGKGSTVRFAEAIFLAHGETTVAFTSPHVASVCERWRIDGVPVEAAIVAAAATVVAAAEQRAGVELTWFERTFAIAVVLAAQRPACRFLCEVGLGGRLDCANALTAAVAVITHLSHDHRDVLGPTLAHIAGEKLAIARKNRPLVIAPQTAAANQAILQRLPVAGNTVWVEEPILAERFGLAMLGEHQQANAATAVAAVGCMRVLDPTLVRQGLATAVLAARCQVVEFGKRRILVDGAHNGPSIGATFTTAATVLRPGWRIILGLARDKEIDEILAVIPLGKSVVRCGYDSPRARDRAAWPEAMAGWGWCAAIGQALDQDEAVDVCVTGSFYLAGEALVVLGQSGRIPG